MSTKVKYFSGDVQLVSVQPVKNEQFIAMGGVKSKGNYYDSFSRLAGKTQDGKLLPVTRTIFYKKNPSLHVCDGRCRHAKGGNCECSCGGQYHGIGG